MGPDLQPPSRSALVLVEEIILTIEIQLLKVLINLFEMRKIWKAFLLTSTPLAVFI